MRYIGKVIDNNSTNGPEGVENGSVSVYIEEIMLDIPKDLYPWVFSDGEFSSNIPEIGDYVWVEFLDEENWRNGFYGDKVSLRDYHEHGETIGSITSSYPSVKYLQLANGVAIGFSSNADTPEISVYHPTGAEIFIDTDGLVSIKGANGTLESTLLGETTNQFFSDLIDGILALNVGTGTGPSSTPLNAATFISLQSQLSTLLSQDVKNS